jgi:bifunctional isochorismate lyase/aryl carrier protein
MKPVPKEHYFTTEGIDRQAVTISHGLPTFRQKPRIHFSLRNSALLVLDMQEYFLQPDSHAYIPSAEAIIPGIQALIQTYSVQDLPIFFTRHLNTSTDSGMMGRWWRDLIQAENPLSEITPRLDISKGMVVPKSQYDAFYETKLDEQLRKTFTSQVVISGVMTHLCCETTARAAFMRGFEVFFLIDGTATYNTEFHRASLVNLAHGFATLITVTDILAEAKNGN